MIYTIVGAGGIGCRLAPEILRLIPTFPGSPEILLIVDRDLVEPKNLDRQFFRKNHIGVSKAAVLAGELQKTAKLLELNFPVEPQEAFLTSDWSATPDTLFFVCVDNHAARKAVLEICDQTKSKAIFGANETTFAEAYYYQASWKDTPLDPRVQYPEILTDETGNPLHPPCTGEVISTPQLGIANQRAAAFMTWLAWAWCMVNPELDTATRLKLPVHVTSIETNMKVTTVEGRLNTETK